MRPPSSVPLHQRPFVRLGALCSLATLFSLLAGLSLQSLLARMPAVQVKRLEGRDDIRRAQQQAVSRGGPAAADGMAYANISYLFTTSLRNPQAMNEFVRQAEARAAQASSGQLARMQLAAFRMRYLELTNATHEQWWPNLAPYLQGMHSGDFRHHLRGATAAMVETGEILDLSPGTASQWGEAQVGEPHGPFLQYFTERLKRVEHSLMLTDPDSARLVRSVRQRLLKQWVLEEGPFEPRLLAADLLSRELLSGAGGSPEAREVGTALSRWRTQFREKLTANPRPLPMLALLDLPLVSRETHDRAVNLYALTIFAATGAAWALVATVLLMLATVLLSWRERKTTAPDGPRDMPLGLVVLLGAAVAGACVIACTVWMTSIPGLLANDLRRGTSNTGWPYFPWFAAAGVLIGVILPLALASRARGGAAQRVRQMATIAATSWLLLAAAAWVLSLTSSRFVTAYDAQMAQVTPDAVRALGGAELDKSLDPLRAWLP